MARGIRLDQALVQRGLFPSRQQAQTAIMAGEVKVNGHVAAKPSDFVQDETEISVAARNRYVGRGGIKLEGALMHFGISCDRQGGAGHWRLDRRLYRLSAPKWRAESLRRRRWPWPAGLEDSGRFAGGRARESQRATSVASRNPGGDRHLRDRRFFYLADFDLAQCL